MAMQLFNEVQSWIEDADKREAKLAESRAKYLTDPTKADEVIANLMAQHLPGDVKPGTKFSSKRAAVEAALPSGDPRKGMVKQIWDTYNQRITDPAYSDIDPAMLIKGTYDESLAQNKESIHQFTYDNKTSPFRTFFQQNVQELPDQANWEATARPRSEYTSVGTSFALGAVPAAIGQALAHVPAVASWAEKAILKKGITKFIGGALTKVPNPYAKVIGIGLLAIPEIMAWDFVSNEISKTKWADENPGAAAVTKFATGMVAAGATGAAFSKTVPSLAKKVSGWAMAKNAAAETMDKAPTAANILTFGNIVKASEADTIAMNGELRKARTNLISTLTSKAQKGQGEQQKLLSVLAGKLNKEGGVAPYPMDRSPLEEKALAIISKGGGELIKKPTSIRDSRIVPDFISGPGGTMKVSDLPEPLLEDFFGELKTTGDATTAMNNVLKTKNAVEAYYPDIYNFAALRGNRPPKISKVSKILDPLTREQLIGLGHTEEEISALSSTLNKKMRKARTQTENVTKASEDMANKPSKEDSGIFNPDKSDLHEITSIEEYREFAKKYGIPNATDFGRGVFGNRGGSTFIDDVTGKSVAFARPEIVNTNMAARAAEKIENAPASKIDVSGPISNEETIVKGITDFAKKEGDLPDISQFVREGGLTPQRASYLERILGNAIDDDEIASMSHTKVLSLMDEADRIAAKDITEAGKTVEQLASEMPADVKSPEFETWFRSLTPTERYDAINTMPKVAGAAPQEAVALHKRLIKEAQGVTPNPSEMDNAIKPLFEGDTSGIEKEVIAAQNAKNEAIKAEAKANVEARTAKHKETMKDMLDKGEVDKLAAYMVKLLGSVAAATTLVSIGSMMSPEQANAAGPDQAARLVTKLVVDKVASSNPGKPLSELVPEIMNSHFVGGVVEAGQKILPKFMRAIKIIPDVNDIARTKAMPMQLDKVSTLLAKGQWLFGTSKTGREPMANPAVQLAMQITAGKVNAASSAQVVKNIVADIPGYRSAAAELQNAMKPIVDEYGVVISQRMYAEEMLKRTESTLSKEWNKVSSRNKYGRGGKAKFEGEALEILEKLDADRTRYQDVIKSTEPVVKAYKDAWTAAVQPLAAKNPAVRMFLAAEDTAEFKHYPWLKDMFVSADGVVASKELEGVSYIKNMMEEYALEMMAINKRPILTRPYMHHAPHPDMNFDAISKGLQEITPGIDISPVMTKIHSRSFLSLPLMPDLSYSMERYLPDINRRLQMNDFWMKGKKGGWWEFAQKTKHIEPLRQFFDSINEGMRPRDPSSVDKWMERLYGLEVARLLGGSVSVPLKHSFKLLADFRTFGSEGLKMFPEAFLSFLRVRTKVDVGSTLATKFGVKPSEMDHIIRSWTNNGRMVDILSDVNDNLQAPSAVWDKVARKVNDVGGAPTAYVEMFDRGFSVLGSSLMAANKGMTPAQAAYGAFDTILKTNFLSGVQNPRWLQDPKIRLLFLFQGTPFKILEQRAVTWSRAAGSIKKAGEELLSQLSSLRQGVKEGEHAFKWELIKQALNSEQDVYGTPVTRQVMREIMIAGTALILGKQVFDADLSKHLMHPPFVKANEKEIAIGASPLVMASYRTWKHKEDTDNEFVLNTFFKEWFGKYGPVPNTLLKAMRLTRADIPEIYRGSSLKYLFAIPAMKSEGES